MTVLSGVYTGTLVRPPRQLLVFDLGPRWYLLGYAAGHPDHEQSFYGTGHSVVD